MSEALQQADQTADRIRGELLRTLEELDRRRVAAMDVRRQAEQNWKLLASAGAVVGGLVGLRLVLGHLRREHERRALMDRRKALILRVWNQPDRLGAKRPPGASWRFASNLVNVAGRVVMTVIAGKVVKRAVG